MLKTRLNWSTPLVAWIALALSLYGLYLGSNRFVGPISAPNGGIMHRMDTEQVIRTGYGVYPPYTQEDPNTKSVSGFSVELVEEIARQAGVRVEWHRLNWNTMAADLQRGTFDLVADPIFNTIPRAREFAFTQPYAYFADGIAVVRTDESRFKSFEDLDQPQVTIAVAKGIASDTLLRARFRQAKIQSIAITNDTLLPFNEVLSGRADAAVSDATDAQRFVAEHVGKVKTLFLDAPPAYMPAGFALRYGDRPGVDFLDVAIRNLQSTGMIRTLAKKFAISSYPGPNSKW